MNKIQHLRFLIKIAEREGITKLGKYLEPLGITPSQSEVLQILYEKEPLSLKEIGDLIICEKQFPSRLVQKLVDKELVFKSISKTDSRMTVLHLTKKGRNLIPEIKLIEKQFNLEIENKFVAPDTIDKVIDVFHSYLDDTGGLNKLNKRLQEDD